MSRIKVDRITDKAGTGAPILVNGMNVTGKSTMGDVIGAAVTFNSVNSGGTITATGGFTGALTGNVTGNLTGDVTGSGANLTNLPSAQLTGALPAIDGSALTGIDANPAYAGIASGSITGGRGVIVADDGKLMAVSGFNGARGTQTSAVTQSNGFVIVYSTGADKFVLFYRDQSDNNKGKASVGTQSGTTITWAAGVTFTTNDINMEYVRGLYDSTNDKVVVAYRDSNNKGSVCVGSISGTSITFGTPVTDITGSESGGGGSIEYSSFCYCPTTDNYALVYNSSSGNKGWCRIGKYSGTNSSSWPNASVEFLNNQARETGCWYDTTANKLVIVTNNGADSNHGYAFAGTISNDAVTFGSGQEYDNTAADRVPSGCHDPDTGKNIIVYSSDSYHGYARTATLSGTTFTFGAATNFSSFATMHPKIAYDSAGSKKFLISYSPYENNIQYGRTIVVTLNGDALTFDTPYTYQTGSNAASTPPSLAYSPDTRSFVNVERSGNTAHYFVENIRTSNMTAGNYVGIANASYTNGQTASVSLPGSVNAAVSGLTVGQKYYAVADGTLSTTADVANIVAGNSVAANKLLVR